MKGNCIFIITHFLNGGGAERVACTLANGLAKRNWTVFLLANKNDKPTYEIDKNVNVVWLKSESSNRIIRGINVFRQFQKLLKKYRPNIIIEMIHVFPHEILLATKLSKYKCPIVISEHDSFERPKSAPITKYLWYKKFILDRFYNYVTVLTEADKKFIGSRIKNIKVMYNPLSLNPVSEIPNKEKIILAVGRIDAWHYKGFDILIKAWNLISHKFPDWKLKIIGSGSKINIDFLKSLIRDSNSVILQGFTENIAAEYKKASIFVLSSRYEGWGLVLVEAMSQGCACIACNYKGRQAEIIINNNNGMLCDTENISMLSEKIKILIEDQELKNNIVNECIKSVQRFDKENIINNWDIFLNDLIKK